jgi:hypothetical protein
LNRQTNIAQTIDIAADKARYDEAAKKLLTYKVIIAWILKSCTREFSQYDVQYIMDHCLDEKPEISERAVHQDQLDKTQRLNGDKRIDGINTEATAIKDQTVYFDIRFKAAVPRENASVQIIINIEIQLDDNPGYPLVKRGFYYCARMISEQYGTVFTDEHYEKLRKVYSIWICPDPAKKRKNGIFTYHTVENTVYGTSHVNEEDYDLMEVVVLNLGDANQGNDFKILDLLNVLFSSSMSPEEKKRVLNDDFKIAVTKEFESEVRNMCNLSEALVDQGVQKGLQQGMQQGMQQGLQQGMQQGLQQGMQQGLQQGMQKGEDVFAQLMQKLFALGRTEDAKKAAEDRDYRHKLMEEFNLAD